MAEDTKDVKRVKATAASIEAGGIIDGQFGYATDTLQIIARDGATYSRMAGIDAANTFTGANVFNGATVFNEAGADVDTRFEGETEQNLLFIDASTDRVGVNTSSPNSPLEVQSTSGNIITATGTTGNSSIEVNTSAVADSNANLNLQNDVIQWTMRVDGGDSDSFKILDSAGGDRFTIDTSGNVGIGTTSPGANLEVSGAVTHAIATALLNIDNTSTGEISAISLSAVADNGGAGNEGAIYFDAGADGTSSNNQLQFNADHQSTTTPDMVITGAGNVGIGTTSPVRALDIETSGTADGIEITNDTSSSVIRLTTTSAQDNRLDFTTNSVVRGYVGWDHSEDVLKINGDGNFSSSSNLVVDSSGNVGIGTSSPAEALDVSGNIISSGSIMAQGQNTAVAGGASFGAAVDVDLAGKTIIKLAPAASQNYYTFSNVTDGQILFINITTTNWANIDNGAIYFNPGVTGNYYGILIYDSTAGGWVGLEGSYPS